MLFFRICYGQSTNEKIWTLFSTKSIWKSIHPSIFSTENLVHEVKSNDLKLKPTRFGIRVPNSRNHLDWNLSNSRNLTDPYQQCFEKPIQVTKPTALFSIKINFLYQNQKVDNDRGMNTNHFKLKERYLPHIGLRLGPGIWLHQTKCSIKFHLHHKYDNHRAVYCQGKKS